MAFPSSLARNSLLPDLFPLALCSVISHFTLPYLVISYHKDYSDFTRTVTLYSCLPSAPPPGFISYWSHPLGLYMATLCKLSGDPSIQILHVFSGIIIVTLVAIESLQCMPLLPFSYHGLSVAVCPGTRAGQWLARKAESEYIRLLLRNRRHLNILVSANCSPQLMFVVSV